ncbi:thiosulfate/3-mercaptopyruvate sulfurtransferase [Alkalithermobacter thermoalcaliphilus JW-YL-7 = DSM 7308]|uniref:3-mercaptopyruvate sulfurtransferase n=1 Tax=Alkalithermobacter thermoalcaliphilus JW-YL-7 = DSM 7308 TaxID=1121328 RepID=A0A150FRM7_CLOPD|nr:3-mercaptopyruvate sulfurtransferase [[Clostridium] paradoxum JW-YL-7 = DSM 7308]SHK79609.1 thiosulfate/3-mercaptopyruvate sulfurtransferase [[Clostridium] paradoxum JW-YL-7 = DSM 7308]
MSNLVSIDWLYNNIDNKNLVIVDCRFDLQSESYGIDNYKRGHIKNAFFMDVNKDLSSIPQEHGGRHPLPDINEFKLKIENIGIDNSSIVVAYDDGDLAGAARFWWLLKYLGHDKAYVLNGGIKKWIHQGYEIVTDVTIKEKTNYQVNVKKDILCDMYEVKSKLNNPKTVIIDSRSYDRYTGEFEPIDKIGGHIPSAKNVFWQEVLKDNELKEKHELNKIFEFAKKYDEIIVYCGSGITGCVNFLVMREIGLNPKLYAGSWSDWISYEDNQISKGSNE